MAEPRPQRPKVIVTRKIPDSAEARLAELFETELNPSDAPSYGVPGDE